MHTVHTEMHCIFVELTFHWEMTRKSCVERLLWVTNTEKKVYGVWESEDVECVLCQKHTVLDCN